MPFDIESLNPAQREAVECTQGPLLVLAGAGSGKTRVLTTRIAHIVEDLGVPAWSILAITFTNKAAKEMRERLTKMMGIGATRGMWVSTFHAMCSRILRRNADAIGYKRDFAIFDDDDSKSLVKRIFADMAIDTKRYPIPGIRSRISMAKNNLLMPGDREDEAQDPPSKTAARVYRQLQQRLKQANAMDFDDLLLNAYLLLRDNPDILREYQDRFSYISVDEYQDTNIAQYKITNLLAERHGNLMVVGDDDQSIYSWRGANIANILRFEEDYPNAHVVRLEQNYRSTGHILAAANAVVANNTHRKGKRLFTAAGDGEKVGVYLASDGRDEGRWIAGQMEMAHSAGEPYSDMALFYRTNAQSRILEDMLLRAGVPYKIVGGTRFFDRAEIRDVMAYLKVVVNPADEASAKRIINTPRRGIGKSTIERLEQDTLNGNITFMKAVEHAVAEGASIESEGVAPSAYKTRTRAALQRFLQIIEDARRCDGELKYVVERLIGSTGLVDALKAEGTEEAKSRAENVMEFLNVAAEFEERREEQREEELFDEECFAQAAAESGAKPSAPQAEQGAEGQLALWDAGDEEDAIDASAAIEDAQHGNDALGTANDDLWAFMEWLALRSDLDSLPDSDDSVTLMTVHSAKGLEFNRVFVAGIEEGIFPHLASFDDPERLEEERRLAYVAITRAKRHLTLTYASARQMYGDIEHNSVSRFVSEIPREHVRSLGAGSSGMSGTGWERRGDRHGTLGSGGVLYGGRGFGRGGARKRSSLGSAASSIAPRQAGPGAPMRDPIREAVVFKEGDIIDHKIFGRGVVLEAKGDAVTVKFQKTGATKKLLKGYAPIVKIEG